MSVLGDALRRLRGFEMPDFMVSFRPVNACLANAVLINMGTEIVYHISPEKQEIKKKQQYLCELESKLTESELELATFQNNLHAFECQYLLTVGILYAELDAIEAQIAELYASMNPDDIHLRAQAAQVRINAEETARETKTYRIQSIKTDFKPSEELKRLYREVAKRVHPDLASDDNDREHRHKTMAEVNRAYEIGDERFLEDILSTWQDQRACSQDEMLGMKQVRLIRQIAQVEARISQIGEHIKALRTSDLGSLFAKVRRAEADGRDLLADMATKVRVEIGNRRQYFSQLAAAGRRE